MKRVRGADDEAGVQPKSVCRVSNASNTATTNDTDKCVTQSSEGDTVKELKHIKEMHAEFGRRRKITLSGLPIDSNEETVNEVMDGLDYTIVSTPQDGSVKLLFPDVTPAKAAIQKLNGLKYGVTRISACFGHPDSLLFVGNIPLSYSNQRLKELFTACGEILRSFIVYSAVTGKSKGYGFVEFATRDEALLAKQKMATKVVGLRSLRVDFADNGMQTCEDLQSCTLFVDKLPKGMNDNDKLRNEFIRYGTVNFCQIALTGSGTPRGFAFIDMNTSEEAELAQANLNCSSLAGHDIRVSFGMPCRPGACILQPRNTHPLTSTWLLPAATSTPSSVSSWVPSVSLVGLFLPDHTNTTHIQALVSLPTNTLQTTTSSSSKSLKQLLLSSSTDDSLTPLTVSADKENETITRTTDREIVKRQESTGQAVLAGHKRRHARADLTEIREEEDEEKVGRSVYDKPFLGQHQQGIPFTHPLKRIRMQ